MYINFSYILAVINLLQQLPNSLNFHSVLDNYKLLILEKHFEH